MKYCPVCDKKFDDEVIRFCTKDGTPLIGEAEPTFRELPSENLGDDDAEVTQIRRNQPAENTDEGLPVVTPRSERIVIPTSPSPIREAAVRSRPPAYYSPNQPPQNTAKTVVLTVLGTLLVLGAGAGLFWLLQGSESANRNINVNTNFNANLNTNVGIDTNFNFNVPSLNTNYNLNTNFNVIANVRSPTPTPTPRPSPSATPSPSPTAAATPTRTPAFNVRPPTPSPTPRQGPRPTASPDGN